MCTALRRPRLVLAAVAALPALGLGQGQGIKLQNGIDTYIDVAYDATLVPKSGLTFEAWVTYDDSTLGAGWRWPCLVRQNPAAGQEAFFLRVDAGQTASRVLRFKVVTANGSAGATWTFGTGQLNTWTHVAGTYDGANVQLYVNGQLVGSAPLTGQILDRGNVLRLGNGDLVAPGIEAWNGDIDEVRLWPVARSAAAILSTMRLSLQRLPGECSTWNLNGNANDSSGKNNGTAMGQLQWVNNTLALQQVPFPGAAVFGAATSACSGPAATGLMALPRLGNAGFGFYCIRAARTAPGLLWLAGARRQTALKILGVDVWVDVAAPGVTFGLASNALGAAPIALPLPTDPALQNLQLHAQLFWADLPCSQQLWTASDGLSFTLTQ